jgi:hypothetical protein
MGRLYGWVPDEIQGSSEGQGLNLGRARGDIRVPIGAEVTLSVTKIASKDLTPLIRLDPDALQELRLGETKVDDERLRSISHLTGLKDLQLYDTKISDAGLPHLASLTQLEELGLCETRITDSGLSALRVC